MFTLFANIWVDNVVVKGLLLSRRDTGGGGSEVERVVFQSQGQWFDPQHRLNTSACCRESTHRPSGPCDPKVGDSILGDPLKYPVDTGDRTTDLGIGERPALPLSHSRPCRSNVGNPTLYFTFCILYVGNPTSPQQGHSGMVEPKCPLFIYMVLF